MIYPSFAVFMGQDTPLHGATPSSAAEPDREARPISQMDDSHTVSGDAQSSKRRRKARMHEVDEATQLVSTPTSSLKRRPG